MLRDLPKVTQLESGQGKLEVASKPCSLYLEKTLIQKETSISVFIAACAIAKTWKQTKCPLTDKWIKMRIIYNRINNIIYMNKYNEMNNIQP